MQFAPAIGALADFGVDLWLEIGPHPALSISIQECLSARGKKSLVVASARREREHESMLETAMDLHRSCVALDFTAMTPSRRLLSLPAYAWDKSRWWNESSDWREGRLGPGGRGLLDTRLPRATPTWIARLDGRQMAFLKDHRVENLTIFPAAAFAEMALEAGVQLFEGRPFVIEDFEIRKPLILPDPPSGLLLELAYEPGARSFAIQSRLEQRVAWSVHVVGSFRGERTDSAFAASTWDDSHEDRLGTVELDEFYDRMGDLGFRYGEEFRPIRELSAGAGRRRARFRCPRGLPAVRQSISCIPSFLMARCKFSLRARRRSRGARARMKLPVRFAKILFLRSPGASSLVRAGCSSSATNSSRENFGCMTRRASLAFWSMASVPSASHGARRSGAPGGRDILYNVGGSVGRPARGRPFGRSHLSRLQEVAREALEQVIASRGRTRLQASMAACDELAAAQLARGLREMVLSSGIGPDS